MRFVVPNTLPVLADKRFVITVVGANANIVKLYSDSANLTAPTPIGIVADYARRQRGGAAMEGQAYIYARCAGKSFGIHADRRAIGSTYIRHDRGYQYRFIKIADPNKWEYLSNLVWQKYNGPIPAGYVVHHIDGNSLNDNPDNLACLSRPEHSRLHATAGALRVVEQRI